MLDSVLLTLKMVLIKLRKPCAIFFLVRKSLLIIHKSTRMPVLEDKKSSQAFAETEVIKITENRGIATLD